MGEAADFSAGAAWIDGKVTPIAEARIPILDWGFVRGDATYDVVHTWKGRFFRLDDHLTRFWNSVKAMRYELPVGDGEVRRILRELVDLTGIENAYVAMIATRGQPRPGSRDLRNCRNQFYAFVIPFVWIADETKQKTGLHMAISPIPRIAPESVDPTVKNYHWLDFQVALLQAYESGAETVVLADGAGHVAEGPGFNIFVAKDGKLATPKRGALEGITRRTVIELGERLGFPVEVRAVDVEELRDADEIFLTSTAGGVMPVTRLEDQPVGGGQVGPVYTKIRAAYWDLHEEETA